MRRFISCALLCMLSVLALPNRTRAEASFLIAPTSITATTVGVKVTVVVPNYVLFVPSNDFRQQQTSTIRVEPCPLGLNCPGGFYEIVTGPNNSADLFLDLGQTYTFSGTYNSAPIATKQYRAQLPTWDVTPVATNADTVWVDVQLMNSNVDQSWCVTQSGACAYYFETFYEITPCPLAIASRPNDMAIYCNNGTMSFGDWPVRSDKQRFALSPGITYTIAGFADVMGLYREQGGNCAVPGCGYREQAIELTYTAPTLRTTASTWGKVKALYRTR